MRVIIVDPDPDVCRALQLLLTHRLGIEGVGIVGDLAQLWTELTQAAPDALILDWTTLGASPRAEIARLHATSPHLQVVVMSGQTETQFAMRLAGADGFICKADSPDQVVTALHILQARQSLPAPEREGSHSE